MAERNGGTNENENRRRLDQMEDVIQSMITLVLEKEKADEKRHLRVMIEMQQQHADHMAEMGELLALQREHRIDIMALFQSRKQE